MNTVARMAVKELFEAHILDLKQRLNLALCDSVLDDMQKREISRKIAKQIKEDEETKAFLLRPQES